MPHGVPQVEAGGTHYNVSLPSSIWSPLAAQDEGSGGGSLMCLGEQEEGTANGYQIACGEGINEHHTGHHHPTPHSLQFFTLSYQFSDTIDMCEILLGKCIHFVAPLIYLF